MTIEMWLQAISEDSPCGLNLEDDLDFLSLEEASRGKPATEYRKDDGEVIRIDGEAPHWPTVQSVAESLLNRSKDLRLAVYLTRALLHTTGFTGIVEGLALIDGLLERYWDNVHPELDADDDNDPTMRLNALSPLSSADAVIGDLRSSYLLQSRSRGQLTVRELEIALGRLTVDADAERLSESQLAGLIGAAVAENPDLPQRASQALTSLKNIRQAINATVGDSYGPDLKLLQTILTTVAQVLEQAAPALVSADPPSSIEQTDISSAPTSAVAAPAAGVIRTRQDVIQTLGRLCDYLSEAEPTNPVQLLLRRAQRMMNMSFLELMQDVAPDGLTQAETVVGEKLNPDEDE